MVKHSITTPSGVRLVLASDPDAVAAEEQS
jgi:hypothetical protein